MPSHSPSQIISANRLADGVVVFFAQGGADGFVWRERIEDAAVFDAAPDADAALASAKADEAADVVVDPYLFAVERRGGAPRPVALREAIRALGPTVRLDLGKQAAPAARAA
ncbi:MAG: DUF2849 domain-containing protein [Hyphomicrobiales bacterium]|nr:DUF2849 domain-containing protein [Hyphomicrobiales bacterium]MDE2016226.1 DUF2849 domain-containing protein [Hyphomicrobiales bacterium]